MTKADLISRLIVVLVIGVILGTALDGSFRADAEKAETLTREEYIADYETHIAELRSSEMPALGVFLLAAVMTVGFFGIYEGAVFGVRSLVVHAVGNGDASSEAASRRQGGGDLLR